MCQTTIDVLGDSIFALMETHNTYRIDLTGPKKYIKGLANQIQEKAVIKYSDEQNIEINII